jgi:hypothetical protein
MRVVVASMYTVPLVRSLLKRCSSHLGSGKIVCAVIESVILEPTHAIFPFRSLILVPTSSVSSCLPSCAFSTLIDLVGFRLHRLVLDYL